MNCLQAAREMVQQIDDLIEKIPDADYQRPLPIFNGSSLGQHFRHILNFYECVLQVKDGDTIDYAKRNRDLMVETNPVYARTSFSQLLQGLTLLKETDPVQVKGDFNVNGEAVSSVLSSIGRELMYAFDHAVHHLAIIRIGLRDLEMESIMGSNQGVAPSTTRHRKAS